MTETRWYATRSSDRAETDEDRAMAHEQIGPFGSREEAKVALAGHLIDELAREQTSSYRSWKNMQRTTAILHELCSDGPVFEYDNDFKCAGLTWRLWSTPSTSRAEHQAADTTPESPAEVYNAYWVRNLIWTVGRELHDMDRLAEASLATAAGSSSGFSRGQSSTWQAAAGYLERAIRQSVAQLGLTEVMEASRAGASSDEMLRIPQRIEED